MTFIAVAEPSSAPSYADSHAELLNGAQYITDGKGLLRKGRSKDVVCQVEPEREHVPATQAFGHSHERFPLHVLTNANQFSNVTDPSQPLPTVLGPVHTEPKANPQPKGLEQDRHPDESVRAVPIRPQE